MSRQNDWKVKQFNKGNCIWCGKPREVPGFKRTCRACGKKHRARLRVKRGSSAWRKPGDMGRPPLWAAVSKTPPRPVESKMRERCDRRKLGLLDLERDCGTAHA